MSRWVLVPALVLCAVAAALSVRFLLEDRDLVAGTPSPRPLFDLTPLELPPGAPLCIDDVTIPDTARELRLQVATVGAPGPALDVRLQADGYDERLTVPGGYGPGALIALPMAPPRTTRLGRVCVEHDGAVPLSLTATTEERTLSRPRGTIGGEPVEPDAYLAFTERRTGTALAHAGDIVDRMSAYRPGIVGPWLLWPLLALVLVGVPGGIVWAVLRAVRS